MLFFVHKVYMLEIGAKMMYNQLKQQNEAYHMKITEILNNGKINISCELFPPKLGSQLPDYRKLVGEMAKVRPSYMSVTYGATAARRIIPLILQTSCKMSTISLRSPTLPAFRLTSKR